MILNDIYIIMINKKKIRNEKQIKTCHDTNKEK